MRIHLISEVVGESVTTGDGHLSIPVNPIKCHSNDVRVRHATSGRR